MTRLTLDAVVDAMHQAGVPAPQVAAVTLRLLETKWPQASPAQAEPAGDSGRPGPDAEAGIRVVSYRHLSGARSSVSLPITLLDELAAHLGSRQLAMERVQALARMAPDEPRHRSAWVREQLAKELG